VPKVKKDGALHPQKVKTQQWAAVLILLTFCLSTELEPVSEMMHTRIIQSAKYDICMM
jgi:hypothetical protein